MMASGVTLATLANEVLDAICSRLNRSSCYALALTCKYIKPSATAALYRTYTNHSNPTDAPFYLFLRTICENPALAELVKEVDTRGWRSELEVANGSTWRPMLTKPENGDEAPTRNGPQFTSTESSARANAATSSEMFHLFLNTAVNIRLVAKPASTHPIPALKKNAQMGTTLKDDADFVRQLKHGVEDAHVILILAQLPKLEKLLVNGLTPYPLLDWHHFFSRVGTPLQSVRILHLSGSRVAYCQEIVRTTLQILDILPNLELLQLVNMSAQGHRHSGEDVVPSRKLRMVSFRDCAVRHRLIRKIVHGQELHSFLYIPSITALQINSGAVFSEAQVTAYLHSSKYSLNTLVLHPLTGFEHSTLHEYINLKHLETVFPDVLPCFEFGSALEVLEKGLRERLPNSLNTLTLVRTFHVLHAAGEIVEALAALKVKKKGLPHLKELEIRFLKPVDPFVVGLPTTYLDDFMSNMAEMFETVLEEAGIELKFDWAQ